MKAATRAYIGTFQAMKSAPLNGRSFTAWRTPDNKHFYLAPSEVDLNIPKFGRNPEHYEVSYALLGFLI